MKKTSKYGLANCVYVDSSPESIFLENLFKKNTGFGTPQGVSTVGVFNPVYLVSLRQPYGRNNHFGVFSTVPEVLTNLYKIGNAPARIYLRLFGQKIV